MPDELKIFGGTSNPELTGKIIRYLAVAPGKAYVSTFPDGETLVKLDDDVRGRDVFVIQSTCNAVNSASMELLIFLDCVRRASAGRITAVMPYFGYARQDRKDEGRVPISAKLMANLLTVAGAHRILTMDLHAAQIQGFFDIPVDHLTAEPVICQYYLQLGLDELVLVSPDVGNVKRARAFATRLGGDLAIIDKRRVSDKEIAVDNVIGNVEGKNVLMIDDMIATAGTICEAARICKERGAVSIRIGATHAVLCGPALDRLNAAPIDELTVTDTIPLRPEVRDGLKTKLTILSVAELLGEAIRRINRDESVSRLFLEKH